MKRVASILGGMALVALLPMVSWGTNLDNVTICHAAGLEGTTQFVELTIAYEAAFGEAGHFFENGTPRAGHEQDYLGPCEVTTTTQGDPEPTATTSTTSTTLVVETTTTLAPTTTIPEIVLEGIEAVCIGDIPYLSYAVEFPGATEVDITFLNPGGADPTYPDQPLSGQVLWPGASAEPPDWPGWVLQDGLWVEADDGFLWARETVTVVFTVNPTQEAQVAYPEATAACANPTNAPPDDPEAPTPSTLPFTGPNTGSLATLGAALVAAGLVGLLVARSREQE